MERMVDPAVRVGELLEEVEAWRKECARLNVLLRQATGALRTVQRAQWEASNVLADVERYMDSRMDGVAR